MKTTVNLIQQLMVMEGHSLEAYKDEAGVPTIGYGHTKGVRMGDRISEQWALELLKMDVQEVEQQVKALNVARTEGQLDALVSFAFNLGIGRLRSSTLLKLIRKGGSKNATDRNSSDGSMPGARNCEAWRSVANGKQRDFSSNLII